MLIVCILLALLCAGLAFWVWAQRRSLREAAYRLRALEDTGSTARLLLDSLLKGRLIQDGIMSPHVHMIKGIPVDDGDAFH